MYFSKTSTPFLTLVDCGSVLLTSHETLFSDASIKTGSGSTSRWTISDTRTDALDDFVKYSYTKWTFPQYFI